MLMQSSLDALPCAWLHHALPPRAFILSPSKQDVKVTKKAKTGSEGKPKKTKAEGAPRRAVLRCATTNRRLRSLVSQCCARPKCLYVSRRLPPKAKRSDPLLHCPQRALLTPAARAASEEGGKKPRKARKPKDPNAPKRATTAFFYFSQDHRAVSWLLWMRGLEQTQIRGCGCCLSAWMAAVSACRASHAVLCSP